MPKKILPPRQINQIIQDYVGGDAPPAISKRNNISETFVRSIVKKSGNIRSNSESNRLYQLKNRKYTLNTDAFSRIEDEESAYWLGFFAADGNVWENQISIQLSNRDIEHLQKFQKWINSSRPLEVKKEDLIRFRVKSAKIRDDLLSLGIGPSKSLTYNSRPQIRPDLIRHFYRGYFDGDGSIYMRDNGYHTLDPYCTVVGTEPFLTEFQQWLVEQADISITKLYFHENICSYTKGGRKIVAKILHLLYDDSNVYLERKHDLALQVFNSRMETEKWRRGSKKLG